MTTHLRVVRGAMQVEPTNHKISVRANQRRVHAGGPPRSDRDGRGGAEYADRHLSVADLLCPVLLFEVPCGERCVCALRVESGDGGSAVVVWWGGGVVVWWCGGVVEWGCTGCIVSARPRPCQSPIRN